MLIRNLIPQQTTSCMTIHARFTVIDKDVFVDFDVFKLDFERFDFAL